MPALTGSLLIPKETGMVELPRLPREPKSLVANAQGDGASPEWPQSGEQKPCWPGRSEKRLFVMAITSSARDLRHGGRHGELRHESNRRFSPRVRHHRRERHHLSGGSQAACDCLAGGTVHRSQLLAAQPAHQTQTGASRDPSAGLVTEVRPAASRRDTQPLLLRGGIEPVLAKAGGRAHTRPCPCCWDGSRGREGPRLWLPIGSASVQESAILHRA
jgi:hypothetical protein